MQFERRYLQSGHDIAVTPDATSTAPSAEAALPTCFLNAALAKASSGIDEVCRPFARWVDRSSKVCRHLSFSAKVRELVRMAVEEVLKNGRH